VPFLADDLGAWLVALLADAGRRKLITFVLGDEQVRALHQACRTAMTATAAELRPGDARDADEVAMVVDEVLAAPDPALRAGGPRTLLEALQVGIAVQLAVLDDRDITTESGWSSADALGLSGAEVAEKLASHLVQEITGRGARGGPLEPLANQLGHDRSFLLGLQLEGKIDRMDSVLVKILAIMDPAHAARAQDDKLSTDLRAEVNKPVLAFLANFEICLTHVGSLEEQLALLPDGIWPVIDATAYGLSDAFMQAHQLRRAEPVTRSGVELRDALAFLLKAAWQRGYFMYKFRRFDCLPPANSVDAKAIMAAIARDGSPGTANLATGIEVTLQRAVSLCTEVEIVRKSLQMVDPSLAQKLESFLPEWSDVVRSAHAWGILSARAEEKLQGTDGVL
jgi:hypothetical protein